MRGAAEPTSVKTEIRNPNSEGSPKSENRTLRAKATFRILGFGFLSDLGIRFSELKSRPLCRRIAARAFGLSQMQTF
jgi:hypothetical protein